MQAIINNYRLVALVCGIVLLAFGFIRAVTQPVGQDPIWERSILSLICFAYVAFSSFDNPIRRHPFAVMSALTSLVVLFSAHLAHLTNFSVNSCFSLLLVIFVSSAILRTRGSLAIFQFNAIIISTLSISIAEDPAVDPVFFVATIITLCLFTYISQEFTAKMESNLRLAESKALQAAEARTRFLANMSHEIRTPMNGVIGMTHLLLATEVNKRQRRYLNTIRVSGDSLLRVIDDILDFSKIDAGKIQLDIGEFSPKKCITEAAEVVRLSCENKGLELLVSIDTDVPKQVTGDDGRLGQVILNLLNNAIKFTHKGCVKLRASGRTDGDTFFLTCEVEDTGIGIEADVMPYLFEAFSQADTSTTRQYGGTGLGLSISQHLIKLMGGNIRVSSAPGRGSKFSFEIPLTISSDSQSGLATELKPHHSQPNEHPLYILLAEDNAINQQVAIKLLENDKHRVDLATDGKEALASMRSHDYDLVLMDLQMPELNGLEVTTLARSEGKTCPIIALTANAFEEDRQACLDAGMNAFLAKPLRKAALDDAIAQTLRHESLG